MSYRACPGERLRKTFVINTLGLLVKYKDNVRFALIFVGVVLELAAKQAHNLKLQADEL